MSSERMVANARREKVQEENEVGMFRGEGAETVSDDLQNKQKHQLATSSSHMN